jgi:hypothetical protein
MKEVLSIFIKRLSWGLAVLTLMLGSLLLARGEGGLIGALLLGYMAALVFVWNMAWRLWRIAEAPTGGAAKQMLWGLVLRIVVLLLVLLTDINISAKVFGVTALGFLLCYGMAMFLLIHMNLR